MNRESLRARYAHRRLYEGDLCSDPGLKWLQRTRPFGLSYPCRLPECRVVMVRTAEQQLAWFCSRAHAAEARKRLAVLRDRIERIETELATVARNGKRRPTTARGRALENDLHFLQRTVTLYE